MASLPQISTSRIPTFNSAADPNPYATFTCFCYRFNTKEHAQLMGVLSFSLFICLVAVSLFIFGPLAIFFISIGVLVYSFLMHSLFHLPEKMYVLAYLIFEAIQISFYIALALFIIMPLVMGPAVEKECEVEQHHNTQGNLEPPKCLNKDLRGSLAELLVCVLLLASVKIYFSKVFTKYYKFLIWAKKTGQHCQRAQYVNGRDVCIDMSQDIFPSSLFWPSDQMTRESGYSYLLNNGSVAPVPSYNQVTNKTQKQPVTDQLTESHQTTA